MFSVDIRRQQGLHKGLTLLYALSAALSLAVAGVYALQARGPSDPLERGAEDYVLLALDLGSLRPQEIDSYFGPPALDRRGRGDAPELPALQERAAVLLAQLAGQAETDAAREERRLRLLRKAEHLAALLDLIAAPGSLSFAEEARRIYGIELPALSAADFEPARRELEELLPGSGTLAFRLAAFRNQAVVPGDRRQVVFERALAACRERSAAHWPLHESPLTLEWSRDIQAAWYRYGAEGGVLQVNPLSLGYLSEALELACHEGYPGHHAQFVLYDRADLPLEDRVVLLRSPEAVLREAAAMLAAELAFPGEERLAFETAELYPLAGLSAGQAARQLRVHALLRELGDAVLPVLLEYRDGDLGRNSATFRLEREALVSSPEALLAFVDEYGAYTLGYTAARRYLQALVAGRVARGEDPWDVFAEILIRPDAVAVFAAATWE